MRTPTKFRGQVPTFSIVACLLMATQTANACEQGFTTSTGSNACVCDSGYSSPPLALSYTSPPQASHNGQGMYHASVLAHGRVYMVPHGTKFVAVVDPANVAGVRREQLDEEATYFVSALLAPDGRIWMTPSRTFYEKMGVMDPLGLVQTTTAPLNYKSIDIDWGGTDQAFCDAVLANNGHIYMIPRHADVIGDFDIASESFQTIDISGSNMMMDHDTVSCDCHVHDRLGRVPWCPARLPCEHLPD